MGKEQNNNYYDEIYKRGGSRKLYFQTAENIKLTQAIQDQKDGNMLMSI